MTKTLQLLPFERIAMAFGFLKLLLLFVFFASFPFVNPADANEPAAACKGENLLVKLEEEDPLAYRQVVAQAEQVKNSNSLFWKVEKQGLPTSYLFGTMHMADPEIAVLKTDLKRAMESVDTLVVESTDVLDPKKSQQAMAGLAHLTLLSSGTLRDLVMDDLEDELAAAVEARGIPMALADRMQPWLIATTISLPICEIQRKQSGELVLDAALVAHAQAKSKQVKGLETAAEQLEAIASLPVSYHVSALEETLASGSLATDMIQTLKDLYLEGNVGMVFPLMQQVMPKAGDGEGAAQFQEALIEKRNLVMAERAGPILETESAFIAVGALHLLGETGLVKLLRDQGYTVTALR